MKKTNIILLITGIIFILFSCSKDNTSLVQNTSQSDQETISLKFSGTPYSGRSDPTGEIISFGEMVTLPNGNVKLTGLITVWTEDANDEDGEHLPLLSGPSTYYENATYNINDPDIHFWGRRWRCMARALEWTCDFSRRPAILLF